MSTQQQPKSPSRARLNLVRFTPGAHTAWHKHAVWQTLHVTDGIGYVLHVPPRPVGSSRRQR